MSVLVDGNTRLLVQGITGKQGSYHTEKIIAYGTSVVAGVSPGKGGQTVCGNIPVFNTAAEARRSHPEINASMIIVPPGSVLPSALEAMQEEVPLIVIITEFVPVHDAIRINRAAKQRHVTVVGGNTIGVISPGKGKIGVMPDYIYQPGRIGVISRSGTLTHETASNLTFAGFGQSTCVGIGGDAVVGLNHTQVLELMKTDPETEAVIMIGEIGGTSEEDAAAYLKSAEYPKPVFAYIAGTQAPPGKKMGHAGAIVSGGSGTAESKVLALRSAGVQVAETAGRLIELVSQWDRQHGGRLSTLPPIVNVGGKR